MSGETPPERGLVAFYAPMKAPDHPNPSGDRRIARLMMRALERAGWTPRLASRFRAHQRDGNPAAQDMLFQEAERIADGLIRRFREEGAPKLWFTYHCYYKAPDLIGPAVARALSIPYVVAEGYRAKKRLAGPYARFAHAAERALDEARIIFHLTHRGLDALVRDRTAGQQIVYLPPFTALGEEPAPKPAPEGPLRLLTVAMMRKGDKTASFHALAAALARLGGDWRLDVVGDGEARAEVEAAFAPFGDRARFLGRIDDRDRLRAAYEAAEVFVWPGVNEAFGMVYLEAQAAGTVAVAEDREGVREVVAPMGRLAPPEDAAAFAAAIAELAADRAALGPAGQAARDWMKAHHGVNAAAARLDVALGSLA